MHVGGRLSGCMTVVSMKRVDLCQSELSKKAKMELVEVAGLMFWLTTARSIKHQYNHTYSHPVCHVREQQLEESECLAEEPQFLV